MGLPIPVSHHTVFIRQKSLNNLTKAWNAIMHIEFILKPEKGNTKERECNAQCHLSIADSPRHGQDVGKSPVPELSLLTDLTSEYCMYGLMVFYGTERRTTITH